MAKKDAPVGYINLIIPAGMATPAPPIGPALGQHGVNIKQFTDEYNAKTADMEKGVPIPVVISVYKDKSFSFIMKQPPNTYFIKKALKLKSGSNAPGAQIVGALKKSQVKQIAEAKMVDLNAVDIEGAMKIIEGSARSMGVEVVEG
ncbi:MAG: 50S ribosomal protein L11 [Alphaproteobacteria bacterium]|nr:50S ribosomal protein L11 [Alphaproteobacteria bacterium]